VTLTVIEERKSLFARRDLVVKLQEIASSRGISLYSLVNSVFENYIKLSESGVNPEEALDLIKLVVKARSAGFILVPEKAWCRLLELAGDAPSTTSTEWRELGVLVAKQLAETPGDSVLVYLSKLLELMGAREALIKESNGALKVRVTSAPLCSGSSRLLLEFITGFLAGLNYSVEISEASGGIITLTAKNTGLRVGDY
jgi:hypothetical protein